MIARAWIEQWRLREPFRLSNAVYETSDIVVVEVERGGCRGRGEAAGVDYLGETVQSVLAQLDAVAAQGAADREQLAQLLPPGGARNALDCALWDLEAKLAGRRVWEMTGARCRPLHTFVTLGMAAPGAMAAAAAALGPRSRLKLKLGDDADVERLQAVRSAVPGAELIVDANGAWDVDTLDRLMPALVACGVQLIEQPLPAAADAALGDYASPIALCADESCHTSASIEALVGRYDVANVKLDKAGGLTEALRLAAAAAAAGLDLMVGCNSATSLGIAPAWIVGQRCTIIDLDWHLLNQFDRPAGFAPGPILAPFAAKLWG